MVKVVTGEARDPAKSDVPRMGSKRLVNTREAYLGETPQSSEM